MKFKIRSTRAEKSHLKKKQIIVLTYYKTLLCTYLLLICNYRRKIRYNSVSGRVRRQVVCEKNSNGPSPKLVC